MLVHLLTRQNEQRGALWPTVVLDLDVDPMQKHFKVLVYGSLIVLCVTLKAQARAYR